MGKTKGKKDPAKKEARAARQEKKLNKGDKKKGGVGDGDDLDEEDLEKVIEDFRRKEAEKTSVRVSAVEQPSPRANFSMVGLGNANGEFMMFGGEFCNGENTQTFNDVYRWNVEKNQWKVVESLNTPAPRCSHQAVYYNEKVYLFGGELATLDNFHHYKDMWELDTRTNVWREIEASGDCPGPRSGHRMVVWRNYIVLFGGFYEAKKEHHWFNDLYLFSFKDERWTKVAYKPLAQVPRVRSGMQMVVHPTDDTIFMYGGFSKEKLAIVEAGKREGHTHDDLWMIDMKPALSQSEEGDGAKAGGSPPKKRGGGGEGDASASDSGGLDVSKIGWTKLSKKGSYPSPRSGAVMAFYKNKGILFGGVHDNEEPRHGLKSRFHDDMFTLDLSSRRWYTFEMNMSAAAASGASGEDGGDGGGGGEDETVFESMRKASLSEGGDERRRDGAQTPDLASAEYNDLPGIDGRYVTSYFSERYKHAPCPRINPALIVRGNKLYLYGGVCELSDIEVALDDCWVLDLNKRSSWCCVTEGTMSRFVWKGAITEGTEGTLTDDDEEEDAGVGKDDGEDEGDGDGDGDERESAGAGPPPQARPGESLREYYARTAAHWTLQAEAAEPPADAEAARSGLLSDKQASKRVKELRKTGFSLCERDFTHGERLKQAGGA